MLRLNILLQQGARLGDHPDAGAFFATAGRARSFEIHEQYP
jgi:hypothetical protein